MMVSQACYSSGDRRYSRACPPYAPLPERRYLSPHDGRTLSMAESPVDMDSQPQRKRISVACGRCRKRKIRCSGDPGGGMPCSNCKNAGSEPCLFLRVQSTEATMRNDHGDFSYNVQDARTYANRAISQSIQYPQDLPALGPAPEMLNPYRSGSPYGYATKPPFYSAVPTYSTGYADDYDYGLNCQPAPVLNNEVGMVPYPWPPRNKQQHGASAGIYVESDGTYAAYGGSTPGLVGGRTHTVAADSPNFSLSSIAAHLPQPPAVGASDRMLPNPGTRTLGAPSAGLPYATTSQPFKSSPPTTTAQMAVSAAGDAGPYSHAFDAANLPYGGATGTAPSHGSHGYQDRVNAAGYPVNEQLFSEHDHNMRSSGSAVDLSTYAYADSGASSIRRGSGSSSQASTSSTTSSSSLSSGSGSSLTSGQPAYISNDHHHHQQSLSHHHHHHHNISAAAAAAAAAAGNTTPAYLSEAPGLGSGHADSRRAVVGGRR